MEMKPADNATHIVITLGPTDETIDDIMKITNMSTGSLGTVIAQTLMARQTPQNPLQLWLVCNKTAYLSNRAALDALIAQGARHIQTGGVKNGVRVLSEAQDMLDELKKLYAQYKIDYIFHSAAVGDYVSRYASSATQLAREIHELFTATQGDAAAFTPAAIAQILAHPKYVFNQDAKMSSDEPDMVVGLQLTPKVISQINGFAAANGYQTGLISWKLLSGVTEEELYDVALQHGRRNGSLIVVANDLDRISDGGHWAMLINVATGERQYATSKQEIAQKLAAAIGL